jgi:hypothetical protein
MKSRKSFLLRIAPQLYDALDAWAQQEFRSVNGQIEFILREAVSRRRPSIATRMPDDLAAHGDSNQEQEHGDE